MSQVFRGRSEGTALLVIRVALELETGVGVFFQTFASRFFSRTEAAGLPGSTAVRPVLVAVLLDLRVCGMIADHIVLIVTLIGVVDERAGGHCAFVAAG